MKINIHLLRSIYSFSLIKVQTDLKLWVKQTLFLSIQKLKRLPRSPLTTLRIS